MGTGVAVGTLGGGDQLPSRGMIFPPFPFNVAGKEVERIDGLRLRYGSNTPDVQEL
jgi:hypothetical protein